MHSAVPVVVGSGITGLAISHALARSDIDHVLIGRPPAPTGPRLGESLNLEGSADFLEMFPEFLRHAYPKTSSTFYVGDYVTSCPFAMSEVAVGFYKLLGFENLNWFLHVDRTAFDFELYHATVAHPRCRSYDDVVGDLDYDHATDRITSVTLGSGEAIEPSYVFDGTNQVRLLARTIGIPIDYLGDEKRVVFSRASRAADGNDSVQPWEMTTNLVRHIPSVDDGLDALSWCIPMGDTVSIGCSMPADLDVGDGEAVLAKVAEAFRRRGVDYGREFTQRDRVLDITSRSYMHERGHGKNWLLAGSSFCQVWFMSGAGVGTSLAAARLAPRLLADPDRVGAEYERFLRKLDRTHRSFDWMLDVDPYTLHRDKIVNKGDIIIGDAMRRMMDYVLLHGSGVQKALARGFQTVVNTRVFPHGYCRAATRPMREQAGLVPVAANTADRVRPANAPTDVPLPTPDEVRETDVVNRLTAMLCGQIAPADAAQAMHPDLVMHLDDRDLHGVNSWLFGVSAILHRGRDRGLRVDTVEIFRDGDRWRVVGRWRMDEPGPKGLTPIASVTFRFEDGLVCEIWSSRRNYFYPLGRAFRTAAGFNASLVYWWLKSRRAGRSGRGHFPDPLLTGPSAVVTEGHARQVQR